MVDPGRRPGPSAGEPFRQGGLVSARPGRGRRPTRQHLRPTLVFAPGPARVGRGGRRRPRQRLCGGRPRQRPRPRLGLRADAGRRLDARTPARRCRTTPRSASPPPTTAATAPSSSVTSFLTPTTPVAGRRGQRRAGAGQGAAAASSTPPATRSSSSRRPPATGPRSPTSSSIPKAMKLDGSNPTILYAYGGFQVSDDAGLFRHDRQAVAGARRRLCAGQHPRRRRVRAGLARGGAEDPPPAHL